SSQLSSGLADEFAAKKVPEKVHRTWWVMEKDAQSDDLRDWMARSGDPKVREKIQLWAASRDEAYAEQVAGLKSFAVLDRSGVQLANSEDASLVGTDVSHRDYFHGNGSNALADRGKDGPLRQPHLCTRLIPLPQ